MHHAFTTSAAKPASVECRIAWQTLPRKSRQAKLITRSSAGEFPGLVKVKLKRPLGIVLAEDTIAKRVFVEELAQGGNAEKSGRVAVGDIVAK